MKIHNLGLPRIGEKRELKFILERYWREEIDVKELETVTKGIRLHNLERQLKNSLDLITVGDFSLYDQVLDHTVMFCNIPQRFQDLEGYDQYFAIARGGSDSGKNLNPSKMQKWFNSNYHYIVPEFSKETVFSLNSTKLLTEINEAIEFGIDVKRIKPVIIGPLTYLWLGGDMNLTYYNKLSEEYKKLFIQLKELGIEWLQVDEPILSLDRLDDCYAEAFKNLYNSRDIGLNIILTTYFESVEDNLDIINNLDVTLIHVDITDNYSEGLKSINTIVEHLPKDTNLSLGIISGRNIWNCDYDKVITYLRENPYNNRIEWIAPSSSLLHLPVTTSNEFTLNNKGYSFLTFAYEKLEELSTIRDLVNGEDREGILQSNREHLSRLSSLREEGLDKEIYNLDCQRTSRYHLRKDIQKKSLLLKDFPTTTIGSFPQTTHLRRERYRFKQGKLSRRDYETVIKDEIKKSIKIQEELDLDVLVHGEPERNDMVEYFAELLDGYLITEYGWVQSYGSRCVKPSIIYKDIKREESMTVDWISYASSLTDKPVKGMLTGPITMLKWAFVRQDISYVKVAEQIAYAINQEVKELIEAGIKIIQIDEAALKEALPLKKEQCGQYQKDAARVFRLCSRDIPDHIQIHTHMCYSDFQDILECLKLMDFDVITIETTRSKMEILTQFKESKIPGDIGPGVYDIHSPNIPTEEDITELISIARNNITDRRLWVNPDCGLKTRSWEEVIPSLKNMVAVAKSLRS